MNKNILKSKENIIYLACIAFYIAAVFAAYYWGKSQTQTVMEDPSVPAEVEIVTATPLPDLAVAAVTVAEDAVTTYTYTLDDDHKPVWHVDGKIPPNKLMKIYACAADGFRQVEYQGEDGWWYVRFLKCE